MGRKKEEKRIYSYNQISLFTCDGTTIIWGEMLNFWVFFFWKKKFYANKACF